MEDNTKKFELQNVFQGHENKISKMAWSPDGLILASGSKDGTIRLWSLETGKMFKKFIDIKYREKDAQSNFSYTFYSQIWSVEWSPDGQILASGNENTSINLWDIKTGKMFKKLQGHTGPVVFVAWSPDGLILASGSKDGTIRLWDTETWEPYKILEGHKSWVMSLKWSPDGKNLASGSVDKTIRVWNIETGEILQVFEGHTKSVISVDWSPDGLILASASDDMTIRFWDPKNARRIGVLEGHTDHIIHIAFSYNGLLLASKSLDNSVRIWRCDTWDQVAVIKENAPIPAALGGLAFHPEKNVLASLGEMDTIIRIWNLNITNLLKDFPDTSSIHYINAKIVLVGESGVGKTGLAIRIAENEFYPTISTHGAQFWQIPVSEDVTRIFNLHNIQAELTLWDLAGQPEYHLVHQLFLDDTDCALILFDCSDSTEPFRGVPYWSKVLEKQSPSDSIKYMVSSRCDVSPVTVGQHEINGILVKYKLNGHFLTSAKTTEGVEILRQHVLANIPWDKLPRITTPRLFQDIREFLLEQKEAGITFTTMKQIWKGIKKKYTGKKATQEEINAVVGLLQGRGLVHRIEPSPQFSLILLRPELINQYASSIIQAARNDFRGIGAISEREVICSKLPFSGFERLGPYEEKIVLESTIELFIQHDLCFREMGMLIFPSQLRITRPYSINDHPPSEVTYEFSGSIEAIYASLVVRLSYTDYFKRENQWKYAVEFTIDDHRMGFAMKQVKEGTGELEIYFYPEVSDFNRVTFIRFITDHLRTKGIDIQERIRLFCSKCDKEVENRDAIESRVKQGKIDIPCQYCDTFVIIPHSIEELYSSDKSYIQKQQQLTDRVMKRTAQEVKDFKIDHIQYFEKQDHLLHILHLSDLHIRTSSEANKYRSQLETDLKKELKINRLDYLVISGDIANFSTQDEYEAAFNLVDSIVKRFGLDSERVVIVPGNHDINWEISEEAYPFIHKRKVPELLPEGKYISAGEAGALIRDEELYKKRFYNFNNYFYKKVYGGIQYPLDYVEQGILHHSPENKIIFLALNSCCEIDYHYKHRAEINMEMLSCAMDSLLDENYDDWLKIAVWHHPVSGSESINTDFLQLLTVHGFNICMHGHIHEAEESYYKYDEKRGIHIIGAGTFGAPIRQQKAGIPLQYNLITFDPKTQKITVNTRKKEKPDGAWSADPRWGDKNSPVSFYTINLK